MDSKSAVRMNGYFCSCNGPELTVLVFVVSGAQLSPHHAAAGSDATISPLVSLPVPALPEPQQPPRSARNLLTWRLISFGTRLVWNIQERLFQTRLGRFRLTLTEIQLIVFFCLR